MYLIYVRSNENTMISGSTAIKTVDCTRLIDLQCPELCGESITVNLFSIRSFPVAVLGKLIPSILFFRKKIYIYRQEKRSKWIKYTIYSIGYLGIFLKVSEKSVLPYPRASRAQKFSTQTNKFKKGIKSIAF